jgi:branched-chain amino acid transport system ATP-binding protein
VSGKTVAKLVLLVAVIAFPWYPFIKYSQVVNADLAAEYALIAFSLVILTGWVGQISLGQGAFVGIGAFVTGLLINNWNIPFPVNVPIVAVLTGGVAAALGLVALRVRGLYLAVATLIFAWLCDAYLFTSSWLVGKGGAASIIPAHVGKKGTITYFDLANKKILFLVLVAAVAGAWFACTNLRNSKTGRAFFAVRGSETAAVSLGIDVNRYKLLAFAISGALAGIAGNLIMIDLGAATPFAFQFTVSFFYLAIAVVGGISSLGGGVAAGILFAALSEAFFRIKFLNGLLDIVTVGLLLGVLLLYPGGLGALGTALSARVSRWASALRSRLKAPPEPDEDELVGTEPDPVMNGHRTHRQPWLIEALVKDIASVRSLASRLPGVNGRRVERNVLDVARLDRLTSDAAALPVEEILRIEEEANTHRNWREMEVRAFELPSRREDRTPILEAEHVVVKFGGLTAVNDVSVIVRENEIVGLIGPNGAGKTTTFNAIAGLNEPTSGEIRLFGKDASNLPVHVRAQLGVGRTFQLIQLFPQLNVFENLMVATHLQNPTGAAAHILLTDKAITAERDARKWVRQVVTLMGLEEVADRRVAGLPFGILRQIEIARALVTQAPFLMLDEPASGLDNAETDELARLLYFIRAELGVSILLIEHDVRMVTSVSDYMYVINRGAPLAEGTPAEVQRHPEVIAAYLGEPVNAADAVEAGV